MKKYALYTALTLSFAAAACTQQPSNNYSQDQSHQNWQRHQAQEWMHKENMANESLFSMIDTNNDGTISRKEYMDFTRNWFREADVEHDGKLTKEEFITQIQRDKKRIKEQMHHSNGDESQNEGHESYEGNDHSENSNGQNSSWMNSQNQGRNNQGNEGYENQEHSENGNNSQNDSRMNNNQNGNN